MSALPPCAAEDSNDCYWDAASHGNGLGQSFVTIDNVTTLCPIGASLDVNLACVSTTTGQPVTGTVTDYGPVSGLGDPGLGDGPLILIALVLGVLGTGSVLFARRSWVRVIGASVAMLGFFTWLGLLALA